MKTKDHLKKDITLTTDLIDDQSDEYNPRNITPENVSYHFSNKKLTLEWWYFEGIFDNGYNAVVNIILVSRNNIGICITHLHLFNKEDPSNYFTNRKIYPLTSFEASKKYPNICVNNKKVVSFDIDAYQTIKKWNYTINLSIDGRAVDLHFSGLSKGWEGNVLDGSYGPVLPMAQVYGTIFHNNETISVNGLGYHEHAHGVSFPVKEWGWYWGKIVAQNTSLFWGKMMNTKTQEKARAGVLSMINKPFKNIKQEYITMVLSDYLFQQRRFIPTTFNFTINEVENNIFITVEMQTLYVYHLPFGFYNYWRYLINVNGYIIHNGIIEKIDNNTQIMELMRFR